MTAWLDALTNALPESIVSTDPDVVVASSRDHTALATVGVARALVRAKTVKHVVGAIRIADAHRVPIVTRGAGTGLAGGANAIDGCIILSVQGLDRILEIDELARTATVEPGVINATLADEASRRGLFYAPDPASRDISTIGGNIATNAGGSCCLKYGVTGDHVLSLVAITAEGELIRTGCRTRKNVAGLDLTRLLIGSEGTLAVIVEATVRLLPMPRPASTLVAFFDTLGGSAAAIAEMEKQGELSLIEMMDRHTVAAVERLAPLDLDTDAAAMVLVQCDAPNAPDVIARCERAVAPHGLRSVYSSHDPEDGKLLLRARRMAFVALEKLGTTLLDDIAVPKPRLAEMFAACDRAASRHDVTIGTFGHAGDGNLHPTIVFDGHDEASRKAAFAAFEDIVRDAIALGGTITGEHGIGSLKADYMTAMVGELERELMHRIKRAFDPKGILNPGKGY